MSFPYNQKTFLNNKVLVQEKKSELEDDIGKYKDIYKELEEILNKLKGVTNGFS
jgi:hypothetical protein